VVLDSRTPRRERHRRDQHELLMLVCLSAVGAALIGNASPVGIGPADSLYRGAFAGLLVWFAGRARRWTWPILAGLTAVSTEYFVAQAASVIALCVAIHALQQSRRVHHVRGAWIATICVPGLLTQGPGPLWRLTGGEVDDPFALSAVITLCATVPVVASGWKTLSRRRRRTIRRQSRNLTIGISFVITATIVASTLAVPKMLEGLHLSKEATQAAKNGDLDTATDLFDAASKEWAFANRMLSGPWMTPSRLIPVVGQHVRAAQVTTGQASALTKSARSVTGRVSPDQLIIDGAINIAEMDGITPAVEALAATAARAETKISAVASPWLIPPVSQRVRQAVELLGRSSGLVGASSEALHVGADLLGVDTPAQLLVMLATPAEARGSGGFVGNWALIETNKGTVTIAEQYQSRELNALLEATSAELTADDDYTARYGRFDVERHIQDVTLSPDFPSVAAVAADLFRQATGTRVQAVLMIDPFVIEKLIGFTGPIDIDGEVPLSGANTARELLTEQYERFESEERVRETLLLGLTSQLMDALLDDPPDPIAFVSELAPLAEQGRLSLWLPGDTDGSIVDRLGMSGAFPTTKDGLLSIVHQNAGQNKIDAHLDRTVDIETTLSPDVREVTHHVTVTLNNNAPPNGLSSAVLGSNDQGLPNGTNRMLVSVYSSDRLASATLDGKPAAVEQMTEFGQAVYSMVIDIAPNDFVVAELELHGQMLDDDGYSMTLGAQPLVTPDHISWNVSTTDGSRLYPPAGWSNRPNGARWAAHLDRPQEVRFAFHR